jgi:hypothetical protein
MLSAVGSQGAEKDVDGLGFASAGTRLTDPQATVLDAENDIRRQDRCLAVPVRWLLCESQ